MIKMRKKGAGTERRAGTTAASDRRAEAVQAAATVLAQKGARGLTHREIDRQLNWPAGSASNYFRRRNDIIIAIAELIMAMDLDDLEFLLTGGDSTEAVDVDRVSDRLASILKRWMKPAHRARAVARAEILFESRRNAEVRASIEFQIGIAESRLRDMFTRLGAANPAASAQLLSLLISGLHMSAIVAKFPPNEHQLRSIVHAWISICAEKDRSSVI